MAAPAITARVTPTDRKLHDGYQSLITFERDPDVAIWEKQITPPGLDGGEPIDQTTMHNLTVRTKAPRSLINYTDGQVMGAYSPDSYNQLLAMVNIPQSITITFSDGGTLSFYGYMRTFQPAAIQEGSQPEATVGFVVTNWDYVNCLEVLPVIVEGTGTCY
jgi:hypothetical protein